MNMFDRLYRIAREHCAWLLLIGFGVFAFFPVLFLDKAFYGEEQSGFYYVLSYYAWESIAHNTPLLWIPHYYGGVPASLDQFVGAWYPVNRILFALFDFFTAHHLSMMLATTAGLLLTYWFGRLQGWLKSTSAALALMYYLATTYGWLLIGTTAAHSFASLPGMLVALAYAAKTKRYTYVVAGGGMALGVGFLAGFAQIVFYNYVLAGLYALFLDWRHYDRTKPFYKNLGLSYAYSGITILGLAIGFLQFFPSAYLIHETIRTSTYAIQHAVVPYPSEFISYFLPPYLYIPFFGGGGSSGLYISAIGMVAAVVGLRYYRTPTLLFFAGAYAMMLAFAFHVFPFSWINEHIPPFSRMGGNPRWMVGAAFPIAFLGAAGIEGLLRNPEIIPLRARRFIVGAGAAISIMFIGGSFAVTALTYHIANSPETSTRLIEWYTHGRTLAHPFAHYQEVLGQALRDVAEAFSLTNPRFVFGVSLWPAATVILYLLLFRPSFSRYRTASIIGFLAFTSAGYTALHWSEVVPQSLYMSEPPIAQIIKQGEKDQHAYRIMGYLVGEGVFIKYLADNKPSFDEMASIQMQTLSDNINLYFDIDRMDGMEPYRTLRQNHLIDTVIAHEWATYMFDDDSPNLVHSPMDQLYNRDVQRNVALKEKLQDLPKRVPLLQMMNVKYLYSPFSFEDPRLVPLATVPVTVGSTTAFELYVYKIPGALPRIYSARSVAYANDQRDAFLAVVQEDDFSDTTWIECVACDVPYGEGTLRDTDYLPGIVRATVSSEKGTWIVLSESTYPGWTAAIDGIETAIYMANYLFLAVYVPPGEHEVAFEYHDVTERVLPF